MERVVVRHLRGSKANNIEQFPIDSFKELLIGRDQTAAISFDPDQDDLVSRRHALIRIHRRDKLSFTIVDLQSSNGTFLNGERLEREGELLVEDRIQLGSGGPEFVFDVEPRPAGMVARTRVFSASDVPHTRLSETRVPVDVAASAPHEKVAVGKETVEHMLGAERKAAGRKWMYAAAAVISGIALVGGLTYFRMETAEARRTAEQDRIEAENKLRGEELKTKYGRMTPAEVMGAYGGATVFIEAGWNAFDPRSGLPIFQKIITINKVPYPAFVKLNNGETVPWLVTDDENQSNFPIGIRAFRGSGFAITQNGFILTNRHVAANWMSQLTGFPLAIPSLLYFEGQPGLRQPYDPTGLPPWVPDSGYLFKRNEPKLLYPERVPFEGRNHRLDVTFQKNKLRIPARLVRTSDTHDVAMIKIDTPGDIPKVNLVADDYRVRTGEPVTILGYPGISDDVTVVFKSNDWFNPGARQEIVPEPTVTPAGIGKVISSQREVVEKEQIRFAGSSLGGSYYQLSTSATGPGNSGGPVFNGDGQVLAIFAAGTTQVGTNMTFAVPISYGKQLLSNSEVFSEN